jgi:hypothetical protein
MTEADDGGVGNLLAARVARCVQGTIDPVDPVLQMLVVADETEQAEAERLLRYDDVVNRAKRLLGSAPAVNVVTRAEALLFIEVNILKTHRRRRRR